MDINEIVNLPKVELHLHLDGSMSLDLAQKLSLENSKLLANKMVAKEKCVDLKEYLTTFSFPISLLQTKKNLYLAAQDLIRQLERDNVIYAEIRFAPMFHIKEGLSLTTIVETVLKGLESSKVKTNLILCMMRGESYCNNRQVLLLAKNYLQKGVCAVDLAGDEGAYSVDEYTSLFEEAKKLSIPFTIHAGEVRSAVEVLKALKLGSSRIGHGIHCVLDDNTCRLIKENNVLLEVCPTSNYQTNSVDKYENHPIFTLYKNEVPVCINTDNRTVSNITLNEEYLKLSRHFGFTKKDFKKMNIMAIEHAFISNLEKETLLKLYE